MPKSRPYEVGLNQRLKEPAYAAAYLTAARQESHEVFLLALRDVVKVHSASKVAASAGVNRETLYRTLSPKGNPTTATLESILKTIGIESAFVPRVKRAIKSRKRLTITASNSTVRPQDAILPTARVSASASLGGQVSSAAQTWKQWIGAYAGGGNLTASHNEQTLSGETLNTSSIPAFIADAMNRQRNEKPLAL